MHTIGNYLIVLAVALVSVIVVVATLRGDPILTMQFALVLTLGEPFSIADVTPAEVVLVGAWRPATTPSTWRCSAGSATRPP